MQASSEHSVCFAVPEKEVAAVSAALHVRFREALAAGRLSKVILSSAEIFLNACFGKHELSMNWFLEWNNAVSSLNV